MQFSTLIQVSKREYQQLYLFQTLLEVWRKDHVTFISLLTDTEDFLTFAKEFVYKSDKGSNSYDRYIIHKLCWGSETRFVIVSMPQIYIYIGKPLGVVLAWYTKWDCNISNVFFNSSFIECNQQLPEYTASAGWISLHWLFSKAWGTCCSLWIYCGLHLTMWYT